MALTKVSRGLLTTSIVDNGNATAITIDSSENVGIGGAPSTQLFVKSAANAANVFAIESADAAQRLQFGVNTSNGGSYIFEQKAQALRFGTSDTERMRIDASGNLLVGTTDDAPGAGNTLAGVAIRGGSDNRSFLSANANYVLHLNRNSSDGVIQYFAKNGTAVGSIGNDSNNLYMVFSNANNCGLAGGGGASDKIFPSGNTGAVRDNAIDLGYGTGRFDNIYATNGTIQTSDRNEKQDIAEVSDAEQRVAVAAKGLMRKFRWIDAVEAKGDDARIHFGIIAQDLQNAFTAEGLDAGRYAMFISDTWWETQTEVAAVEATEDTEAVDAYTRTDTYDTAEEAPEGATERTRLGVRYSELLAFIISAI